MYLDFDRGVKTGLTMKDKYTEARGKILVADFFDDNPDKAVKYQQALDFMNDMASDCRRDPSGRRGKAAAAGAMKKIRSPYSE